MGLFNCPSLGTDLFDHLLSGQLLPHRLQDDLVRFLVFDELSALSDQGGVEEVDEALKVILGLLNLVEARVGLARHRRNPICNQCQQREE